MHSQRKRLIGYAVFAALLGLAFLNPLVTLAIYAAGTDIHSHVLLIPFISAYLIYLRRNELPKSYQSSLGPASLLLIVGSAAFLVSWNLQRSDPPIHPGDYFSLIAFSFVSLLTAGGFLFLGRKWMAAAAFPIAFLTFMIPLPDRMLNGLETVSQLASAEMAALFFTVTGVPMLREGTIFSLPGIVIAVAQECSGIRSSYVLFITTLAASYLFLKSPWRRGVLMAFVIPLAIVRNGFRIWMIGLLCVELGPHMIHSIIHQRGGPLFFALSLIPLFLLLWWLRKREQVKAGLAKR